MRLKDRGLRPSNAFGIVVLYRRIYEPSMATENWREKKWNSISTMWPWQKRKSETELVTALFDDLADSLKKLVLAPRDKYAQRFLKSLSLLEDQAGNLKSESDVHKLGKESEIAIDRFAHAQRDCVERVFFDLDSSLRDLLSIIDETLISSDDFIAKTSSLTTRLSAARAAMML